MCCNAEHGCGITRRDWLNEANYQGLEKIDNVSYEKWLEQEQAESNQSDPHKQNIFGALKESDYIITNNGTMEEFYKKVDEFIHKKVVL